MISHGVLIDAIITHKNRCSACIEPLKTPLDEARIVAATNLGPGRSFM